VVAALSLTTFTHRIGGYAQIFLFFLIRSEPWRGTRADRDPDLRT